MFQDQTAAFKMFIVICFYVVYRCLNFIVDVFKDLDMEREERRKSKIKVSSGEKQININQIKIILKINV